MPMRTYCRKYRCKQCGNEQRLFNQSDVLIPIACEKCSCEKMDIANESWSPANEVRRLFARGVKP